jgi:hypothetical protein
MRILTFLLALFKRKEPEEYRCWNCGGLAGRGWIEMHGKRFCSIACLPGKAVSSREDYRREALRRVQ